VKQKLLLLLLTIHLSFSTAHAAFTCGGSLTNDQIEGFKQLFATTYSPSLTKVGIAVTPDSFAKKITKEQLKVLEVDKPIVVASATLNDAGVKFLKKALNDNAQSSVPGWFSTVIGAFVPTAWIGITADVMVQLINGSGDAGRLSLANVAGTVGTGGHVAVVERVGKDKDGAQKFIWAYSHTANLNGKPTTSMLYVCSADVVVAP